MPRPEPEPVGGPVLLAFFFLAMIAENLSLSLSLLHLARRIKCWSIFCFSGARFAKWRTTVRVRDHSALAVSEAAHGLARYANICQSSGLVPIIEPEILLDGEHSIEECAETFEEVWSEVGIGSKGQSSRAK